MHSSATIADAMSGVATEITGAVMTTTEIAEAAASGAVAMTMVSATAAGAATARKHGATLRPRLHQRYNATNADAATASTTANVSVGSNAAGAASKATAHVVTMAAAKVIAPAAI